MSLILSCITWNFCLQTNVCPSWVHICEQTSHTNKGEIQYTAW